MRNIIGIRREDLDKKGEQRVAIVPDLVEKMKEKGFSFLVQSRRHPNQEEIKRSFLDEEYISSGAEIQEDMSGANIIFGLKEVKINHLISDKAYLFFSHTHKGQIKNRPLLKALMENSNTLIDYELIEKKEGGRILTAFTFFAGYAGMIDSLWAYGKRLENLGHPTVFSQIPQSIEKGDLQLIKDIIHQVGMEIRENGTSPELPPLITCILGNGKTATGAQDIYDILPVKAITLQELEDVFKNGNRKYVYKLVLGISDMYRLKSDSPYINKDLSKQELTSLYLKEPIHFESNLDKVFPYVSILMNCIIWSSDFPRLLSREDAEHWYEQSDVLKVIGDITCDPEGAIQFSKETWIDNPVYTYDPKTRIEKDGFEGDGITVMAVTNLPCEFSSDASAQFSEDLSPYLAAILSADFEADSPTSAGLPSEIVNATILWQGKLTEKYDYMKSFVSN